GGDEVGRGDETVDALAGGRLVEGVHGGRNPEELPHPGRMAGLDRVNADGGRQHRIRAELRRLALVRGNGEVLERNRSLQERPLPAATRGRPGRGPPCAAGVAATPSRPGPASR